MRVSHYFSAEIFPAHIDMLVIHSK